MLQTSVSTKILNSVATYTPLHYLRALVFIAWAIVAIRCDDGDNSTPSKPEKKYLLKEERIFEQKAEEIKAIANPLLSSLSSLPEISFDVDGYKVEYTSSYQDKSITVSGVILLPRSAKSISMLSWQHGTIVKKSNAPSEQISQVNTDIDSESFVGAIFASTGMIVVIPDYIGFGSSSNILHPYIVEEATAIAVADMLQAGRQLALEKGLNFNGKVMLAGHSEGGYATMATHKYLESHPVDNLELIASFPSAGAYDVKAMQEYLWKQQSYARPVFLAYLVYSYKEEFNLKLPLTEIFQEPYADRMPKLFDGTQDIDDIDSELTRRIDQLLVSDIKESIDTDARYSEVVNLLKKNSLTDWAPKIKMHMYHGRADEIIPYSNSQATHDSLIKNGASPEVVTLTLTEGDHFDAYFFSYLVSISKEINSLQ